MSTTSRLPWFPMFASDWLLSPSVRFMTPEQRGMYIQLLCEQWHNGGALPADESKLRLLAGADADQWERSKGPVLLQFETADGMIFNVRLRQLMHERGAWHDKLSAAGKLGMQRRWGTDSKGEQEETAQHSDNTGLSKSLNEVWAYYIEKTERNPKTYSLSLARKRKGMARLKECLQKTSGDLEKAKGLMKVCIDAICNDDWHMGRDPKTNGKRYCEWESHVFKSYEQMEKWWNA